MNDTILSPFLETPGVKPGIFILIGILSLWMDRRRRRSSINRRPIYRGAYDGGARDYQTTIARSLQRRRRKAALRGKFL